MQKQYVEVNLDKACNFIIIFIYILLSACV